MRNFILLLLFVAFAGLSGCKKIVDVGLPESQLVTKDIFSDSASVQSAVVGMYSFMYNYTNTEGSPYKSFITTLLSLSADETTYFSNNTYPQYQRNAIPIADSRNLQLWADSYTVIYMANNILENIDGANAGSENFRRQVRGEALFMRAFCHFYLTNLFGDVPLITTTDVTVSRSVPRINQRDVYAQIVEDLKNARTLLATDYRYSSGERIRVNHFAATAMLARVYLYMGMYQDAEAMSSEVIGNTADFQLEGDLDRVFQQGSSEAIFQFATDVYSATYVGRDFLPSEVTKLPNFVVREDLTASFEPGDLRRDAWVGTVTYGGRNYDYPNKYQLNGSSSGQSDRVEYDMVLRLSEQYLIRAEARIELGMLDGAKDDINELRGRADLDLIPVSAPQTMKEQLLHERRVELFCEWGHRWFDLKRSNRADAVLGALKPTWKSTAVLFPIPLRARSSNTNLSQNPGY
ncbi:RagB/SusD family nutrient uptake outer membrane protein [Pedobacter panaciterrae]|uniref:RagB/SusD family nutrient uptake outer membrane protein n=1 Tax=Pedobacter panaciterrae TaxID=363849 RepID=A0ABU8NHI3_9SPHI